LSPVIAGRWGETSVNNSLRYTVGTALDRALGSGTPVRVLVDGHWISGGVVAADSEGVVLQAVPHHLVVRLADISAVQVDSAAPPEIGRALN